jgi:hypothetical protein
MRACGVSARAAHGQNIEVFCTVIAGTTPLAREAGLQRHGTRDAILHFIHHFSFKSLSPSVARIAAVGSESTEFGECR